MKVAVQSAHRSSFVPFTHRPTDATAIASETATAVHAVQQSTHEHCPRVAERGKAEVLGASKRSQLSMSSGVVFGFRIWKRPGSALLVDE